MRKIGERLTTKVHCMVSDWHSQGILKSKASHIGEKKKRQKKEREMEEKKKECDCALESGRERQGRG